MPTSAPPSEDMMRVTQDVVRDLLPLYFEGEASPDSRILVETWFARDPAFAHLARKGSDALDALAGLEAPPLDQAGARAALNRVHRIILVREVALGLAGALTVIPVVLVALDLLFPTRMPAPLHAGLYTAVAGFLILAGASWTVYGAVRRKFRSNVF